MSTAPLYNSSNDPQRHPDALDPEEQNSTTSDDSSDHDEEPNPTETEIENQLEPTDVTIQNQTDPIDEGFDDLNIEDHEASFFARLTQELFTCAESEKPLSE
jgi:hypothetical protein